MPRIVARVLRELDRVGLHDSFTVIGTQALYAYEAAAGSHFLLELLASGDVDLRYDARQKMVVVSEKLDGNGLLGLLKKADKTFECVRKNDYRAANAGQFMVDLVIAPRGMNAAENITFSESDLVATEVPGLQWLLNSLNLMWSPSMRTAGQCRCGCQIRALLPCTRLGSLGCSRANLSKNHATSTKLGQWRNSSKTKCHIFHSKAR